MLTGERFSTNMNEQLLPCLFQVHALPAWANRGCQISDIVRGDLQWCILTNYMIDLEWLLSACPILYHVPRVVLVHGEAGEALARLQVRNEIRGTLFVTYRHCCCLLLSTSVDIPSLQTKDYQNILGIPAWCESANL